MAITLYTYALLVSLVTFSVNATSYQWTGWDTNFDDSKLWEGNNPVGTKIPGKTVINGIEDVVVVAKVPSQQPGQLYHLGKTITFNTPFLMYLGDGKGDTMFAFGTGDDSSVPNATATYSLGFDTDNEEMKSHFDYNCANNWQVAGEVALQPPCSKDDVIFPDDNSYLVSGSVGAVASMQIGNNASTKMTSCPSSANPHDYFGKVTLNLGNCGTDFKFAVNGQPFQCPSTCATQQTTTQNADTVPSSTKPIDTGSTASTTQPINTGSTGSTTQPIDTGSTASTTQPIDTGSTGSTTQPIDTGSTASTTQPIDTGSTGSTTQPTDTGSTASTTQPIDTGSTGSTTQPIDTGSTASTTQPIDTGSTGSTTQPIDTGSTASTTQPIGTGSTASTTQPIGPSSSVTIPSSTFNKIDTTSGASLSPTTATPRSTITATKAPATSATTTATATATASRSATTTDPMFPLSPAPSTTIPPTSESPTSLTTPTPAPTTTPTTSSSATSPPSTRLTTQQPQTPDAQSAKKTNSATTIISVSSSVAALFVLAVVVIAVIFCRKKANNNDTGRMNHFSNPIYDEVAPDTLLTNSHSAPPTTGPLYASVNDFGPPTGNTFGNGGPTYADATQPSNNYLDLHNDDIDNTKNDSDL